MRIKMKIKSTQVLDIQCFYLIVSDNNKEG